MDGQKNRRIDGQVDGWIEEQTDRWLSGWMDAKLGVESDFLSPEKDISDLISDVNVKRG